MALLPETLETSADIRAHLVVPRAPLKYVVPGMDVVALFVAAGIIGRFSVFALLYAASAFVAISATGLHRTRINPTLAGGLGRLLGAMTFPLLFLLPLGAPGGQLDHFVHVAPLAVSFVLAGRLVAYRITREARARGFVVERTLVVGAGKLGAQVATTLQEHPEFGLHPVGFLDSFEDTDLPLPILGDVTELDSVVMELGIKRVIVAFGATREPDMVRLIRACDLLPVEVHILPRFFELGVAPASMDTEDLWGIPLLRLRRSALRTVAWRTKRAFDLAVATMLMILTSPMFVVAAAAVKMSSPGPVFFRQKRIGQRGEVFECLKFRTMRVNDESDTRWRVGNDEDRKTKVGKILRRTGLDELPQLLNVLKGDMSLIGPRPERPYFVDQFRVAVPGYDDRHRVPAGITGWAQVHGLRGDTSIPERALFDNHYIEHWSLWMDLVIAFRTVGTILRGHGAD